MSNLPTKEEVLKTYESLIKATIRDDGTEAIVDPSGHQAWVLKHSKEVFKDDLEELERLVKEMMDKRMEAVK